MSQSDTSSPQGRPSAHAGIIHPWIARHWTTASGAVVAEAAAGVMPVDVFRHAARLPHAIFLDSAQVESAEVDHAAAHETDGPAPLRLGRSSFVAADPIHSWQVDRSGAWSATSQEIAAAFAAARTLLADLACATIPGLPPFQGGVAGLVSYECGLARLGLEPPPAASPEPTLSLHVYDLVFAYDHDLAQGWFISQGVPARGPVERMRRATERLAAFLAEPAPSTREPAAVAALPATSGHPLPSHPQVRSTHSRESYLQMVRAGIELVHAGDIFQANLAQCFSVVAEADPVEVYLRARSVNPAPFAGYFDAGGIQVASMSPERFLQVCRGVVRTHPIKGTRRMIASPEADLYAGAELEASGKDRAENVMIVDLLRNDLARVCTPASVRVEALCRLERYRYVQHLVSIVAGRLRSGLGAIDVLEAAIPGGSISGAPKHRACEIISTLEGVARGCYCGSLGYVGFDGSADFNLLIRTLVVAPGSITFSAGGGITAASDPAAEYAESLHKAEGMLRVLDALCIGGGPTA
ncbi:MAG: anthranilate synthase component I family protein [Planctomycetia bacterium]|nr:anthranilate synthase component I family protein [Planctomycetia bacterium]